MSEDHDVIDLASARAEKQRLAAAATASETEWQVVWWRPPRGAVDRDDDVAFIADERQVGFDFSRDDAHQAALTRAWKLLDAAEDREIALIMTRPCGTRSGVPEIDDEPAS